jgi:hypothetical protein
MTLEIAIRKARETPFVKGQKRHYAITLDRRGKILSEAANSYIKTSPKMLEAGRKVGLTAKLFWHAECKAIYAVKDISKIHKIIVVRIDSKGQPVNSTPCVICERLIKDVGIAVIECTL